MLASARRRLLLRELAIDSGAVNSEQSRSISDVPPSLLQRALNQDVFGLGEIEGQGRGWIGPARLRRSGTRRSRGPLHQVKMLRLDSFTTALDERSLDDILQLADVAGKIVGLEHGQ